MKYNYKNTILIISILFSLTACGSINNRHRAELISPDNLSESDGIVIISAGASANCTSFATFLKVLKSGHPYSENGEFMASVDSSYLNSDYKDHHGNLHVLKLRAGNYYIAPWMANPYIEANTVAKADFTVVPNKIQYLGEYFMTKSCSLNSNGIIRDNYDRDLKILLAKNAKYRNAPIVKNIVSLNGFAVGGN